MGFFNNPRKATKAFFKSPVRIVNNDISNFEKAVGIPTGIDAEKVFYKALTKGANHAIKQNCDIPHGHQYKVNITKGGFRVNGNIQL